MAFLQALKVRLDHQAVHQLISFSSLGHRHWINQSAQSIGQVSTGALRLTLYLAGNIKLAGAIAIFSPHIHQASSPTHLRVARHLDLQLQLHWAGIIMLELVLSTSSPTALGRHFGAGALVVINVVIDIVQALDCWSTCT